MISAEAITYGKEMRTLIENGFDTIIYRMIIEYVDLSNPNQVFFAQFVADYAHVNKLNHLLFFAIPVASRNEPNIVIKKNFKESKILLSKDFLIETTRHSHRFWDAGVYSYNMNHPLAKEHSLLKFYEADRPLIEGSSESIIHHCFYTAF